MADRRTPRFVFAGATLLVASSAILGREPRDQAPEPGPYQLPPGQLSAVGSNSSGTATAVASLVVGLINFAGKPHG